MKTKILVVDDEYDVATALQVRLKTNGYDVVIAYDSIQGYALAHKERPNLIILDILLPGGGGFLVAQRLKVSAATRHIPVIFLTGISGGEERAYQMGASSYLMKPYNPFMLLGEIKKALEATEGQDIPAS